MNTINVKKLEHIITVYPPGEELVNAAREALRTYTTIQNIQHKVMQLKAIINGLTQSAISALQKLSHETARSATEKAYVLRTQLQSLQGQLNELKMVYQENKKRVRNAQVRQRQLEEQRTAAVKATTTGHAAVMTAITSALSNTAKTNLNKQLPAITNQNQQRNFAQLKLTMETLESIKKNQRRK